MSEPMLPFDDEPVRLPVPRSAEGKPDPTYEGNPTYEIPQATHPSFAHLPLLLMPQARASFSP